MALQINASMAGLLLLAQRSIFTASQWFRSTAARFIIVTILTSFPLT
jgi:hypothetical protein